MRRLPPTRPPVAIERELDKQWLAAGSTSSTSSLACSSWHISVVAFSTSSWHICVACVLGTC
eukprot:12836688-Heterocapsa_arctica.AAC.1